MVLIPMYLTIRPFILIFARKVRRPYRSRLDEAYRNKLQEKDSIIQGSTLYLKTGHSVNECYTNHYYSESLSNKAKPSSCIKKKRSVMQLEYFFFYYKTTDILYRNNWFPAANTAKKFRLGNMYYNLYKSDLCMSKNLAF